MLNSNSYTRFRTLKIPTDLMTLKEIQLKYNYKYNYLYKIIVKNHEIPYYSRGSIKVSEQEFVEWVNDGFVDKKGE